MNRSKQWIQRRRVLSKTRETIDARRDLLSCPWKNIRMETYSPAITSWTKRMQRNRERRRTADEYDPSPAGSARIPSGSLNHGWKARHLNPHAGAVDQGRRRPYGFSPSPSPPVSPAPAECWPAPAETDKDSARAETERERERGRGWNEIVEEMMRERGADRQWHAAPRTAHAGVLFVSGGCLRGCLVRDFSPCHIGHLDVN